MAPWQGKGATGHVAQSDLKNNKANGLTVTAGAKVKVESSVVVGNSDAGVSISDLATGASPCARVHPSTLATQRLHAHSNTTCMASVSSFFPRAAAQMSFHSYQDSLHASQRTATIVLRRRKHILKSKSSPFARASLLPPHTSILTLRTRRSPSRGTSSPESNP